MVFLKRKKVRRKMASKSTISYPFFYFHSENGRVKIYITELGGDDAIRKRNLWDSGWPTIKEIETSDKKEN